jgi:hypothetical protein
MRARCSASACSSVNSGAGAGLILRRHIRRLSLDQLVPIHRYPDLRRQRMGICLPLFRRHAVERSKPIEVSVALATPRQGSPREGREARAWPIATGREHVS